MVQSVVEDLLGISVCESKAGEVLITYKIIDQVLDQFYGGRSDDFWNHPERFQSSQITEWEEFYGTAENIGCG